MWTTLNKNKDRKVQKKNNNVVSPKIVFKQILLMHIYNRKCDFKLQSMLLWIN